MPETKITDNCVFFSPHAPLVKCLVKILFVKIIIIILVVEIFENTFVKIIIIICSFIDRISEKDLINVGF
jgi:hypothetical protein